MGFTSRAALLWSVAACGGGSAQVTPAKQPAVAAPETPYSITTVKDETSSVDPFHATAGPGDASVPYVRDERSSRLEVELPRGRAREAWHVSHEVTAPGAVIAAGNRVAVIGAERWGLFDADGHRVGGAKIESTAVRLDRASGAVVVDEMRSADLPAGARVAARNGLSVMVADGSVNVGERAIEGKFEALDVAIDDNGIACVIVRQANDLSLWTIPTASKGGIGRHRLGRGRRSVGPPILGRNLRIVILDTGIVAFGLDGKRVWERRGVPSGGASITRDDHLLVADGGKIVALDPRGHATEVIALPDVVFTTPPILNARGVLFVASADALHAITFS